VICFTKVRFLQTYSPLRWSQRPGLFQPFPSLKRSPRPSELFSLINGSLRPLTRTTTTWYLLLDYKLLENKNGGRRKAIQATRTQMNTNVCLSQATKSLEWIWDLERIWSFVLCLGVKSRALVLNAMAKNLDALKCGGWGVFIAPPTKMVVGEAVCRWAHRTVRCASHVTQPLGFDRWSSDSPMVHRTGTVHCLVRLLALLWLLHELSAHCSPFADDRWRCSRCSAWHTGQSGATPDSPMNYSGVALQKPEGGKFRVDLPGASDTVRWHTGQSGAPDHGSLRLILLLSFWTLSWTFYWFVLNLWHL
jgi:hypothetical protein